MNRRMTYLALLGSLLLGCSQSQTPTSPESKAPEAKTEEAKTQTPETPPVLKVSDLPAELKHDAFEWYGLGNEAGIKMKLTQGKTIQKGDQKFVLEKVEGGSAYFKQVWGGDLAFYGEARYVLDTKGVAGTEAQGTKVDPPQIELPAKITPGYAWKTPGKLEMTGGSISNLSAVIVGFKPLKVAGRSIQALLVRRTSTINVSGKTQHMDVSEYYEKGVGAVKMEVTMKGGGQPTKSFAMEAIE